MKKILFFIGVILIVGVTTCVLLNTAKAPAKDPQKISIVTTLFPQYDFAKAIGGDKADVIPLLLPGVEAHSFEPKPSDIIKINNADIFIYTGEFMEPWAHDITKSVDKRVKIIDASFGIELIDEEDGHDHHEHEHENHHGEFDPHIWLDFDNAKIMAENIANAIYEVDPENVEYYQNNLKIYKNKLDELDDIYKNTLSKCESNIIIYGGHYAFGYLAKRYGLEYSASQGFSPDSEPTAKDMITLVEQIKKDNISYVFYEELTSPKIAETLAKETSTKMLLLNTAENLTKDDYNDGVSFISIMKENLNNLSIGLDCLK